MRSTSGMSGWVAAIAAGVVLAGAAAPVRAALIAYEGFDYPHSATLGGVITEGVLVGGQDGGSGWQQPWVYTGSGAASGVRVRQEATLNYTDALGQQLITQGLGAEVQRTFRSATRTLAAPQNAGTVWVGFLIQPDYVIEEGANVFQLRLLQDGGAVLNVGKISGADDHYGLSAQGQSAFSTVSAVNGERPFDSQFLVLKVNFGDGENGSVHLFVNPGLTAEPLEAEADAVLSGLAAAQLAFNQVRLDAPGGGAVDSKRGFIDEIRVAGSFQTVAPIPEPGGGLLVLGLAGGLIARRRFRS